MLDISYLRDTQIPRTCDVIIWPDCHEHVERIVALACKHNVVIIPCGGNTNVTHASLIPVEEKRMVVGLDMTRMTRIKWVDKINMTACIEAGIRGVDLIAKLKEYGCTSGHEPDSVEFSTAGGWVATRCSGMKKNLYGNTEDFVVNMKVVTP